MIESISIQNFKCFSEKKDIKLAKITILYGHNGRGKSSLSQALLLIGQSMKERNDLDQLSIVGEQVKLDTFADIRTIGSGQEEIKFWIDTDREKVEMGFSPFSDKPQLGRLSTLLFNGEDRFVVQTTQAAEATDEGRKVAFSTSDISVLQQLKSIVYISAGRLGPVNDVMRNDSLPPNKIGTKGENLLNALSHQTPEFIAYVGQCLSRILKGGSVKIPDPGATRLELLLNSRDDGPLFHPVNVGFGYSYVLPVIVGTLLAEKGSIVIIENPEAHLHPGAQSRIMEFLIEQSIRRDLQLIIETHSDHVVNGMRISMKEGALKPSDSIIQHFAYTEKGKAPEITCITSDASGNLSDYPDDFQDEWTAQMLELV
jgi:predicted ATPase